MSSEVKDFFSTYSDFVKKVTSDPSLDMDALKNSLDDINNNSKIEVPRLLTAALGLESETGGFVEWLARRARKWLSTASMVARTSVAISRRTETRSRSIVAETAVCASN